MPPKRRSKKKGTVTPPQENEIPTPTGLISLSEYLGMNQGKAHCGDANCKNCKTEAPAGPKRDLSPLPHYVSKSKFSKHLFCPICMEVLHHPVRLFCGHVYCAHCIKQIWFKWLHSGASCCPLDRIAIRWELVHFDLVIKKLLAAQLVYCTNRKNSCRWEGLKREQEDHVNTCSYKEIPDWLKAIKKTGEEDSRTGGFVDIMEDEELAEILEREAPDVDLMTRMYFKNQNLVNNALGKKLKPLEKIEQKPLITKRSTKNSKNASMKTDSKSPIRISSAVNDLLNAFDETGDTFNIDKLLDF